MRIIKTKPIKRLSSRAYVKRILDNKLITETMMQEAALAFEYAEQFQSPQKEEELVRFILSRSEARLSKAA